MSSAEGRAHLARLTPLQSLRRHWVVGLLLAVLAGGAGFAYATYTPNTITAETRLAVGTGAVGADALVGVPYASSQFAANYARYLDSQALSTGSDVLVDASQIPDSNIVRIEAKAPSASAAVAAADEAGTVLVAKVDEATASDAKAMKRFRTLTNRWSAAQSAQITAQIQLSSTVARTDPRSTPEQIDQAQDTLSRASSKLAQAQLLKDSAATKYQLSSGQVDDAQLVVVQPARVTDSARASREVRYSMLGVAVGLGLALVIATGLEARRFQRNRPRREEPARA